jgi:hypothetical protein
MAAASAPEGCCRIVTKGIGRTGLEKTAEPSMALRALEMTQDSFVASSARWVAATPNGSPWTPQSLLERVPSSGCSKWALFVPVSIHTGSIGFLSEAKGQIGVWEALRLEGVCSAQS